MEEIVFSQILRKYSILLPGSKRSYAGSVPGICVVWRDNKFAATLRR